MHHGLKGSCQFIIHIPEIGPFNYCIPGIFGIGRAGLICLFKDRSLPGQPYLIKADFVSDRYKGRLFSV